MNRSGSAAQNPLRSMNMNYPQQQQQQAQQRQQPSRLQNASKGGLGNGGLGGWNAGAGAAGGFGNVGGGLGGTGRPQQLSGFAQVMGGGGGGGQGAIDMSDFPTLSGGPRQNAPSAAAGWNSAAIRQTSAQHQHQAAAQQAAQHQQRAPSAAPSQQSLDQGFDGNRSQQASEQGGRGDEFPPLGGPGQLNGDGSGLGSTIASPTGQQPNGQQSQLPIREASNAAFQPPLQPQQQQAPIGPVQQTPQQAPAHPNGAPPPGLKRYADMTDAEKYGLTGLAAAFEARRLFETGQASQVDSSLPPAMRNAVFLGQDLSLLGLDLDSPEPLYPSFAAFPSAAAGTTAFDYVERNVVPNFGLPPAYTVTNVPSLEGRLGGFSDETLFAIFYLQTRSTLQELASIELTSRDWRFHKVLRQWLQKDNPSNHSGTGLAGASGAGGGSSSLPLHDFAPNIPVGSAPMRVGLGQEKGAYVFFNPQEWRRERRDFVLDYAELEGRSGNGGYGAGGGAGMATGAPPGMSNGVGGVTAPAPGLPQPGSASGTVTPAPGLSMPGAGQQQVGAGA